MGSIAGAKTDLINALSDTNGIGDSLLMVSTSGSNNLYKIYQLVDYSLPGDIIATIIDNNGLVIDTMDRTIGTYSDDGYMDIFSTISALARMPDGTNNPFYPTTIPAATDSTKLNLLIAAMLDLSIAHNSPLPESNEQKQGIQTNYMQFMDNTAGNWGTLRTATRGIGRLRAIHERVLEQNKGEIIDPVYVVNYGTSFEPHTVTQKRKNYAFIEGFSRINWNCVVPSYGTSQAGTGIMFRVSENVELYRAFIKNSFPTFDTVSFLNGAAAQRLIVPANDTLINKFISKDGGVWVKGIPETEDVQFYSGIIPVRLPIAGVHNALIKIDTAFSLTTEAMGNGDPVGKIVDYERSVLGVYAISNNGESADTLENIEEPGVLLHGQKRKLVYNTDYSTGDRVEFSVLTKGEDTGKVFIESKPTSNTAILADTSVTANDWIALATVFANGMAIQSIGSEGATRRLGFKDVVNSILEVWCDNIVALAMERDDKKLIKNKVRRKLEIAVRTTNGVKLYTSSSKTEQITAALLKARIEGDKWITSWKNYEDVFLKQDNIYATIEPGIAGECAITAQWKKTQQEYATEKVTVLGVPKIESIEFTSDHEDAEGFNMLRMAERYKDDGVRIAEPECKCFTDGSLDCAPISHTCGQNLHVVPLIMFPKIGTYHIVGEVSSPAIIFEDHTNIDSVGCKNIELVSNSPLPSYASVLNLNIIWKIYYVETIEQKIFEKSMQSKIYLTYGSPILQNSLNQNNSLTDVRLNLVLNNTGNLVDPRLGAHSIRNRLINVELLPVYQASAFLKSIVVQNENVWSLWDQIYFQEVLTRSTQCGPVRFFT